ncbi:MAG: TonB-dependent receptor [Flavobacteriales bacterium]
MKTLLLQLIVLGTTISSFAQGGFTISGTITEEGSGETLPGVVIVCLEQEAATSSNNYGFYSLTLNGESAVVYFKYLGYEIQKVEVSASSNNSNRYDIALVPESNTLQEVVISAEETERISEETQMSKIEIPIDQIKKIPALLGEKDVLKVIQLLPGVQKGSEGSSGFYVRGGGPDQNLIILDDATVYNASHLFGFFSIFNGDALKSVELIKGGFPARYGGRLSSVLEMQMKDGNKEEIHGEAGIGLVASRLTLEGPIKKKKSSFLVSARRTYIDALIYPFLPQDGKAGYYFYDLNAKLNFILDDRNRLYISGYFGKDKFYFKSKYSNSSDEGNLLWGNASATARLNHIINDKTFSNTSFIFSKYQLGINSINKSTNDSFELRYRSGIRDWTVKHDIDYRPNSKHYIRTGASLIYHRFSPSAITIKSSDVFENTAKQQNIDNLEGGVYVEDDWSISSKLKANMGLRYSNFITKDQYYNGL